MTEHINKNNRLNNITHLALQFVASWFFVGYIRIHILDIPYGYYKGYSYDFIATFACMTLLYFFVYKKWPVKVDLEYLIFGVFFGFLCSKAMGQSILNTIVYLTKDTMNYRTIEPYIYIPFLNPIIMYLLAFINKKAFFIFILLNIAGIITFFYT